MDMRHQDTINQQTALTRAFVNRLLTEARRADLDPDLWVEVVEHAAYIADCVRCMQQTDSEIEVGRQHYRARLRFDAIVARIPPRRRRNGVKPCG